MVIVGPCSLHDPQATLAYAEQLQALQLKYRDRLLIVMRAYVEKPRTSLGWKGMIYDPHLDNTYDIKAGLHQARALFLGIIERGLPLATEFLDPIVPQYLADLVSWAAIGARTAESQIHRQMVSGLSMPIGFKNGTDGNLSCAVDAIQAAASPHSFLGIDREGKVIIAETKGNAHGHLVMRGGHREPNYGAEFIAYADTLLSKNGIHTKLIVDCSHANSSKDFKQQGHACLDVVEQIKMGNGRIAGVMLESFLKEGRQSVHRLEDLAYGISITDACIGWEETKILLQHIAEAKEGIPV
jgi:3-deoxy-7-phosphoheptulonate synthase